MNHISLVEICGAAVKQIKDPAEAIAFIEKVEVKVKATAEAVVLCKVVLGNIRLYSGNDAAATKVRSAARAGTGHHSPADSAFRCHGNFLRYLVYSLSIVQKVVAKADLITHFIVVICRCRWPLTGNMVMCHAQPW